jgi:YVTN family beta-propeller protein
VAIDTATNTVAATVTTDDLAPFGIAITPDGAFAYVTHLGPNVSVIDTATNTVVTIIETGGEGLDIAITPDGEFA